MIIVAMISFSNCKPVSDKQINNKQTTQNEPSKQLEDIVNIQNEFEKAVKSNNAVNAISLIKQGANVNTEINVFEYKFTPLYYAIKNKNAKLTIELLNSGADITKRYSEDYGDCIYCPDSITYLHTAVLEAMKNDSKEIYRIIRILVENGSDINSFDATNQTPLCVSAYGKSTKLVDSILNFGGEIEIGKTSALHNAAKYSNYSVVKHLLENGANPEFKNEEDKTAKELCLNCCGDGFGDSISEEDRAKTILILNEYSNK